MLTQSNIRKPKESLEVQLTEARRDVGGNYVQTSITTPEGIGYNIVTDKLGVRSTPAVMELEAMTIIIDTLFLVHPLHEKWGFRDIGEFQFFYKIAPVSIPCKTAE